MPRTLRSRSRPGLSKTGKVYYSVDDVPKLTETNTYSTGTDTCSDYVGTPIVDSSLTINSSRPKSVQNDILEVNGKATVYWFGKSTHMFDGWPVAVSTTLDTTPLAAPSGWMLDLVAGTNPSRPVISPPMLAQDLIELPKMVYNLGKLLQTPGRVATPAGIASEYLGIKFGWLPLIDDINHLLNVQSYVLKRSKELNQLYSGRGLRRRLRFGESTANERRNTVLRYVGPNFTSIDYDVTVTKRSWGTIHWYPTSPPPYSPSDDEQHKFARRIVLGLTPEGIARGLWDVIPWTWLLGWFTNVGKYTLAYSNTVPARHGTGCFMSQVRRHYQPGTVKYSGAYTERYVQGKGSLTLVRSTRQVSSATYAGANLPFLDGSRLSVLGALFAQRFMR